MLIVPLIYLLCVGEVKRLDLNAANGPPILQRHQPEPTWVDHRDFNQLLLIFG